VIRRAHQALQPPLARKNTSQKIWELVGVVGMAGRRGVALHPATPANSQIFWAVFVMAGGGWRAWCAPCMRMAL
jgi:hypothetical protein